MQSAIALHSESYDGISSHYVSHAVALVQHAITLTCTMVNVPTAEMSDFADYIATPTWSTPAWGPLHSSLQSNFLEPVGCRMLPFAVCPGAQTLQRDGTTASGVLSAAPTQQSRSFWRHLNWRGRDFGYLFAS